MFEVYIEPHERQDALEAYAERLSDEQILEIEEASEEARIRLIIMRGKTEVNVLP